MPVRQSRTSSKTTSAENLIPKQLILPVLKDAAADCQACDLWRKGTQTVFGDGRPRSSIMFVGEQPGNEEDLTGKPFVGPAGKLFDSALAEAGGAQAGAGAIQSGRRSALGEARAGTPDQAGDVQPGR